MKVSNLIPITQIYDIYPKYTYSEDVKKFMDEIVDIKRADVFTKADMVNILDKIRTEIKELYWQADKQALAKDPCVVDAMIDLFIRTIDKYKAESEVKK